MGQVSAVEGRRCERPTKEVLTCKNPARYDGLYITVEIGGVQVNCLIDSGATTTVIHPKKYYEIPSSLRPALQPAGEAVRMADGGRVYPMGQVTLPFKMGGSQVLTQTVLVMDMEAPAVIGYDFLFQHNCRLDVSESTLTVNGEVLACRLESEMQSFFRIQLQGTTIVPPRSEVILAGVIEGQKPRLPCAIIEPTSKFLEKQPVVVAKALVDAQQESIPVRAMNFSDEARTIYKGTTLGTCQAAHAVCPVTNEVEGVKPRLGKLRPAGAESSNGIPGHLLSVWEKCQANLDAEQQEQVKHMLLTMQGAFAKSKDDLGRTSIVQHRISTGDAVPIKQPTRRRPISQKAAEREEIAAMLEKGVIEPSMSPWASPVVLVTKKDGSLRFCVDFRKVNALTCKDSYFAYFCLL